MTKITTSKTLTTTTTTSTTTTTTSTTLTTTSTSKYDWCNLDNYDIAVQQRLNSSKDIIVVDELFVAAGNTYEKAKSVCENICGRLYFPSTLKENDEVESFLNRWRGNRYRWPDFEKVWLRMTYNETVGTWYDPDNKEDLTFLNFNHFDETQDFAGNKDRVSAKLKNELQKIAPNNNFDFLTHGASERVLSLRRRSRI